MHFVRPAPLEPTSDAHQELGDLGATPKKVSKLFENCIVAKNWTPRQPVPPVEVSMVGVNVCPLAPAPAHVIVGGAVDEYPVPGLVMVIELTCVPSPTQMPAKPEPVQPVIPVQLADAAPPFV